MANANRDGNFIPILMGETNNAARTPTPLLVDPTTKRLLVDVSGITGSGTPGGADTQVQFNDGGNFGGDSALIWNKTDNQLGIGGSPSEALHIQKTTGNYTTIRFDSGTTQGYFFAYDGDNSVNIGSTSDATVNFKQNNATRAFFNTDGDFNVQQSTGQHTWITILAPSGDPQEATLTTKLDLGSGNTEFVDWTIENYGTDHKASINIAKTGTGTILPFIIRTWDADLGNIAANGKTYFTITPSVEIVMNDDSQDVDFRVESDGNANMLFVDAGNNRVGIGMNNPTVALDVTGAIKASSTITGSNLSGTNTGDQTTISGNAGSATVLATARAIYGNNFDGSAALTQIIASTYGGTGNGFTKFSGPATAEKTFTLPNATCTILTTNAVVTVAQGGTGATTLTGLVVGNGTSAFTTVTAPSGTVVGTSDTQTLTNKRITARVQSVSDAATVTPDADANDAVDITAIAQAFTIANPTGTPTNFQKLIIRIKDNGTARAITWGNGYVAGGVSLPTTTVLSKILTLGFIYNTANTLNKWQLVASAQEA